MSGQPTVIAEDLFDAMTAGEHLVATLDIETEEAAAHYPVEQVESRTEYRWMAEFAASLDVARLLDVARTPAPRVEGRAAGLGLAGDLAGVHSSGRRC